MGNWLITAYLTVFAALNGTFLVLFSNVSDLSKDLFDIQSVFDYNARLAKN